VRFFFERGVPIHRAIQSTLTRRFPDIYLRPKNESSSKDEIGAEAAAAKKEFHQIRENQEANALLSESFIIANYNPIEAEKLRRKGVMEYAESLWCYMDYAERMIQLNKKNNKKDGRSN